MIAFLVFILFLLFLLLLGPWMVFWAGEYLDWVAEKMEALHEKRMERKYKNDGEEDE